MAQIHDGVVVLERGEKVAFVPGSSNYVAISSGLVFSSFGGLGWRMLRPIKQANGYTHVTLSLGGSLKQMSLHSLIATMFCPGKGDGLVVNHKNCDRADNRADNLEWVTQSQNVLHAYANGRRVIDEAHRQRCALLGLAKRKATRNMEDGCA